MKTGWFAGLLTGCAAALLFLSVACEDKDSEEAATQQNSGVAGRWFVRGGSWDRTMDLTQDGVNVAGTVTAPNGNRSQSVRGTINGSGISLVSGDVTGSGVIDGQTMRGKYSRTNGDSGEWRAWR